MEKNFYVTTPIYYSNGVPHIGHSYSSFLADTIAKYKRFQGKNVRFTTGVDENSQKVVESAQEKGMQTMEYADMMAGKHRAIWDGIGIGYTNFVRTTSENHKKFVQEVLQKTFDAGDIYEGEYEGLYCVGCEAFKKEKDLVDGHCPDHPNKEIQHIREKNYFFRLSKYQDQLLKFYEENPEWITPRTRYNEVIEFVKGGLEDFSISRETNKFGIPLPFDPEQVTYVWFDALYSYMSTISHELDDFWPADLHVIGKDIVKFHGIYWPAMLMSAGYELPKQLLTTGHFTVDGQKMSKTIGNVIDPVEYCQNYSRDGLLLYLFTAFPIGEDGDFDQEKAIFTFNAKLSNNVGNLLNRAIALTLKIGGTLNRPAEVISIGDNFVKNYASTMEKYDLKNALESAFEYATEINKYVDDNTPWKLDAEAEKEKLETILYTLVYHLRRVAIMLLPFFTEKMQELLSRVGVPFNQENTLSEQLLQIPEKFVITEKGEPLYMRINVK